MHAIYYFRVNIVLSRNESYYLTTRPISYTYYVHTFQGMEMAMNGQLEGRESFPSLSTRLANLAPGVTLEIVD